MKKLIGNYSGFINSKLSYELHKVSFGRYQNLFSCAVRPDRYSELIVEICVFRPDVENRYPNADESYLAVDMYYYHGQELRKARREKLLLGGLREYWAIDLVRRDIKTYQENSSGRIAEMEYNFQAKVPIVSFPDIEIDVNEIFGEIGVPEVS